MDSCLLLSSLNWSTGRSSTFQFARRIAKLLHYIDGRSFLFFFYNILDIFPRSRKNLVELWWFWQGEWPRFRSLISKSRELSGQENERSNYWKVAFKYDQVWIEKTKKKLFILLGNHTQSSHALLLLTVIYLFTYMEFQKKARRKLQEFNLDMWSSTQTRTEKVNF